MSLRKMSWGLAALLMTACGGPPPGNTGGPDAGGGSGDAVKLPVGIDGLARGEVRLQGGDFSCAEGLCLLEQPAGATITLTATPASGAVFTGWSGDCSGTGTCTLQVSAVSRVHASFGVPGAWSRAIGSSSGDVANAVVRDASGNITLVGFMGAGTVVGGQAIAQGKFIAQFDATGHLRWSRPLPPLSSVVRPRALADGALLLAGTFTGTVQLGTASFTSAGDTDILVAKVSAAGEPLWARRLGGSGPDRSMLLEVDPAGDIHVGGDTDGFQPEGASSPLARGGFVVTLAADGTYRTSLGFLPGGPTHRLFDSRGRNILVGDNENDTFDLWALCQGTGAGDSWDYTPREPTAAGIDPVAAHLRADDSFVVAGHFSGYMGDVAPDRVPSVDLFLLNYSPDGKVTWSKRLGGDGLEYLGGMAVDGAGNLLLAGSTTTTSTLDFGGGELLLDIGRGHQALLARLAQDGTHLWSTTFGGTGSDHAVAVASGPGGTTVVGDFEQSVDFGDAVRTSAGAGDIFLLTLP